jgi:hypothetical protein
MDAFRIQKASIGAALIRPAAGGSGNEVGRSYLGDPSKAVDHFLVTNNIVYDNIGIGIGDLGITGKNNLYQNNLGFANQQDWRLQNGLSHSGTVAAPPGFARYDPDGMGNYLLMAGLPAIDRGAPTEAAVVDYSLAPRPQGLGADIGPFESVP